MRAGLLRQGVGEERWASLSRDVEERSLLVHSDSPTFCISWNGPNLRSAHEAVLRNHPTVQSMDPTSQNVVDALREHNLPGLRCDLAPVTHDGKSESLFKPIQKPGACARSANMGEVKQRGDLLDIYLHHFTGDPPPPPPY